MCPPVASSLYLAVSQPGFFLPLRTFISFEDPSSPRLPLWTHSDSKARIELDLISNAAQCGRRGGGLHYYM